MTDLKPCAHPTCATPTYLGVCTNCQGRARRELSNVVLDWVHLHTHLPLPVATGSRGRRTTLLAYGHPAEWASDQASLIAGTLWAHHDNLADALGDPVPDKGSEQGRVQRAWDYLECRIDQLAHQDWVTDALDEWHGLHKAIRQALGQNRPKSHVPTPCPNCTMLTLYRTVLTGQDHIECENPQCGKVIYANEYAAYAHELVDKMLASTTQTCAPDTTRV